MHSISWLKRFTPEMVKRCVYGHNKPGTVSEMNVVNIIIQLLKMLYKTSLIYIYYILFLYNVASYITY